MNPTSLQGFLSRATSAIGDSLGTGGGAVLWSVDRQETFFTADFAGKLAPRIKVHMALTLLRQARDDLHNQAEGKPLSDDDECLLMDLGDIISELKFYDAGADA